MDQPVVRDGYQRLGRRTLLVFLLRMSWVPLIVILLLGSLVSLLGIVPAKFASLVIILLGIGGLLGLLAIAGTTASAWLAYDHYGIALGATDFRYKHGIITEEQIGIPYRRIKEVKIRRSSLDMMLGVSTLMITAATEDGDSGRSMIRVDALDKNLASQLYEDILKRAAVERVQVGGDTAESLH